MLKQCSRLASLRLPTREFYRRISTTVDKASFNAIVTGGASGIGEAVCSKLASRGINVLIADLQAERGNALAKRLSSTYSVDVHYTPLDVSSEQSVKDMVESAVQLWGRIDYAANCAGICESTWAEEESITTELVDKTYAINQRGLWLCQKHEALQMKKQDPRTVTFDPPSRFPVKPQRGSIVNIASVSALNAMGLAAYTPTKHAALGITRNGAKFYGPDGIRCNATCPSWTFTTMLEGSMGDEGHEGSKESEESSVCDLISLGRMAFAQEQANVVSFLLSSESSYINGAYIVVDGGYNDIR